MNKKEDDIAFYKKLDAIFTVLKFVWLIIHPSCLYYLLFLFIK